MQQNVICHKPLQSYNDKTDDRTYSAAEDADLAIDKLTVKITTLNKPR